MARRVSRWLVCLPLLALLLGCSPGTYTQRVERLYDAVRSQPQLQPPADAATPGPAPVSADPIAKADVLVFAARPGDVVVSAYAAVRLAVAQGQRVVVVYVTSGDARTSMALALAGLPADATPTPEQYLRGAAALQDAALEAAESALGIDADDVFFLGYPDGVLHEFSAEAPDHVVRSPFTGKDGLTEPDVAPFPYRIARSGQSVPYSFNAILHDLNDVLVELNPSEIYLPSPDSADETEAAAGRLIARALREVAPPSARVFVYATGSQGRPPDRRVPVTDPAAKQRALAVYTAAAGGVDWLNAPEALLAEEVFWEFDYTGAS